MGVTTTQTNKPFNPRGNDQSPKGYNRAALYSGKALDFDGVNDYLASGAFSLDTSEWSASMILKNDTAGSDQVFLTFAATGSNDESFIIYNNFSSSNKISFYGGAFTGSPIVFDYVIPTDYEHLTFTFASNTLSLYANGVFVDSGSVTGNDGTQTASAIVGARKQASYAQYFNGQVSGLKMYSTALTAAQVADLYNNPEKVVPTGVAYSALKLWLPMMEGAGTTAYDGSGNGNHGTISGATYVNGIGAPVAQTAVIDWNKGSNLFEYSEQFDTAYWPIGGNTTLTSGQEAPDGSQNAYRLQMPASSGTYLYQSKSTTIGQDYTISVWAKANTESYFCFVSGTNFHEITITNEWARYSVTFTASSSTTTIGFDNGAIANVVDCFIWGAQLEQASTAGPYIPNHTATQITSPVLLPQGLTTGRDITGVNLFENVRKQGALNLDGNSWAEVHDNESVDFGSGSWTAECWVYWDGTSNGDGILSRWYITDRAMLIYAQATNIRLFTGVTNGSNDNDISSSTISVGWRHIVGTYDSSDTKLRIYIDGSLDVTSAVVANAYNSNAQSLEIGRYNNDSTKAYTNNIAQPRIYNRALTAEEVQRNYNAGKNTYTN